MEMKNVPGRWQQQAVHAMNDSVRAKHVNGDDTAVEVDGESSKSNLKRNALRFWLRAEMFALEKSWGCLARQDPSNGIEVRDHMVGENGLELLLGWLWCFVGNFLKRLGSVNMPASLNGNVCDGPYPLVQRLCSWPWCCSVLRQDHRTQRSTWPTW